MESCCALGGPRLTIRVQGLLKEKELRAFFVSCDSREEGQEPAWEEHLRMLERSKTGRDSLPDRNSGAPFPY